MKAIQMGILVLALGACGARQPVPVTPTQRTRAATVLLHGGTVRDVASQLAMSDDQARRVVQSTIKEMMRGLRRDP